jgi:hypothetical protein
MPTLDDLLDRQLRAATPTRDPLDVHEQLVRRKRRRTIRRTAGRTALAGMVLAASAAGVLMLGRAFEGPEGSSPAVSPSPPSPAPPLTPTASPAPEPSATPEVGRDIGLGFRVCSVSSLGQIRVGDVRAKAWTAIRVRDGRCPDELDDPGIVAVDLDGDGAADAWHRLTVCTGCEPWGATDLDADGVEELVVLLQFSSTPNFGIYRLVPSSAGGPAVTPILVAEPGAREAGFPAGKPVELWSGGDEGFTGAIACEAYPSAPVLVVARAEQPVDGAGPVEATVTRLRLEADGLMHVISSERTTRPASAPLPITAPDAPCGVRFNPL